MKKITFLLFGLLIGLLSFGQTTVTIGAGTLSASGVNGTPIYRSSATSTFNFSQSVELLTPSDLSAVGITAGATITKIAYKKLNAFTLSAGRTATMRIYLKNSSTTALGTTTNFATYTTGSTLCYNNTAYSNADLPAVAGWVEFNFGTPFNYTGGSIEVGIDWAINTGTGNPTDGAFSWEYTTVTANQAVGTSNSVAITGNLATANTRIYNTQLTFTNTPCVGTPAPGNTVVSTTGCFGSSATLSVQNPTIGSGVTYQWYMNSVAISGATNSNYVISSLATSDTYYCEVTCAGNTTASSSLVVAPSLLTAPLLEPFDVFLPSCWINMFGGDLTAGPSASTGSGWLADGFANSGTTGAIRNEIWTTGANDWVISPVINIPTVGYELKFDAAATQFATANAPTNAWESDDFIEVLVSTTGLTNWTPIFTYNNSNQPSNTGTPNIIDLDAYSGQNIRIAFRAVEGTANGTADIDFSIDNFQLRLTPTCVEPLNIVTSGVTSSTINISWDPTTPDPATGYEYFVSTASTVPVTAGTATTNTFAIPSGLLSNTTYYVFVRSDCGAGDFSSWTGPISFTTTCAPFSVPVLEQFNTFLPSVCWTEADNGDLTAGPLTSGTGSWVVDGFGNVGTTGAARVTLDGAADNDWIISPEFIIPATGYELRFEAAANQSGTVNAPTTPWESDDFVEVLISTTGTTNWSVLYTYNDTNTPSNTGSINIIDLDAYSGQNVRFAYRAVEGATNGAASIDFTFDNFQIRLTPTCVEPLNLVSSSVTFNTANISWDATSPVPTIGYEYFVSTTNTVPVTAGTATTSTFASLSGLLANTTYYIFVRSDCGAGDFSSWTGPISFYTGYCLPSSSGNATYVNNFSTTGGSQNISNLATGFTTGGYLNASTQFVEGYATSVFNFNAEIIGGTAGFSIWVDWNNDMIFDNATEKVFNTTAYGNGPFTGSVTIPTGTAIGNYRMRITTDWLATNPSNPCAAVTRAEFEDYTISVIAQPACVPAVATASGVTDVTANLSWTAVPSAALGYEYVLDNVATDPTGAGTSTAATTFAASGLTQLTTYYFHIRSVCSAGTFSTWSTVSFTTLNSPPVNDNLCNATLLTLGTPTGITNTLVGATAQTSEPVATCLNSGINGSVWFSFVAPSSGSVEVSTDFAGGTLLNGDTEIAVYASNGVTCSDLTTLGTALGCDQDGGTTVNFSSFLTLTGLTSGDTYYIQVDRWGTATAGTFGIQVSTVLNAASFDTNSFVAYPNPVKDILNLSYKTAISNVRVINLLGQEVINTKSNDNNVKVDMSALSAGAYMVNITVEDTVHTIKVIKE